MINKDINIKVLSNSMIILDKAVLGISGENLQGKIIFNFEEFVDGVACMYDKVNKKFYYNKRNRRFLIRRKGELIC